MDFSQIQQINCPNCNKNNCKQQYIVKQWKIVQCIDCSFVYTNPRLTNKAIKNLYEINYFKNNEYGYVNYNDNPHLKKSNFSKWINDALPYLSKNNTVIALDIGCAAGFAFPVFEENNIKNVEGIELDADYVIELQNKGYTIFNKPLLENNFNKKYSIITLFDVVEHLTNLDEHLIFLNNIMQTNGIMVVVTPDYASVQRKIFGKRWFQFKPMEHINYFTLKSFTKIAQRNGFQLLAHKKSGQFADANFIITRLQKYNFPLAKILISPLIGILKLMKKNIYLDAASFFAVYQKK